MYDSAAQANGSRVGQTTLFSSSSSNFLSDSASTPATTFSLRHMGREITASVGPNDSAIPTTATAAPTLATENAPASRPSAPPPAAAAAAAAGTPSSSCSRVTPLGAPSMSVAAPSAAASASEPAANARTASASAPRRKAADRSRGSSSRGPLASRRRLVPSSHHTPGSGSAAAQRAGPRTSATHADAGSAAGKSKKRGDARAHSGGGASCCGPVAAYARDTCGGGASCVASAASAASASRPGAPFEKAPFFGARGLLIDAAAPQHTASPTRGLARRGGARAMCWQSEGAGVHVCCCAL